MFAVVEFLDGSAVTVSGMMPEQLETEAFNEISEA
jgi:hypothetical protein